MSGIVDVGVWTAVASGLALGVLGLTLLWARIRRPHTTAFAGFLLIWSGVILFGNLSRVAALVGDFAGARRWILLHIGALIPLHVPLIYFASTYPAEDGPFAGGWPLAGLLVPSAVGVALYAFAPGLFLEGFVRVEGRVLSQWGPAYVLFSLLLSAAFYYTLLVLHRAHVRSDHGLEARRNLYVLLALVLYVGFRVGQRLALFGGRALAGGAVEGSSVAFTLDAVAGLAVLAYVAGRTLADADPLPRGRATVGVALVGPPLFGLVAGASLRLPEIPTVETLGLLRLAAVALIAYAILRYELFDIDDKVRRAVVGAGMVGGAVAVSIGFERLLGGWLGAPLALALAQGVLLGGIAVLVLVRPGPLSADPSVAGGPREPAKAARRLEVYESALLQAAAKGRLDDPEDRLADLRRRLGITDAEHDVLHRLAVARTPTPRGDGQDPGPGTLIADRYHLADALSTGAYGTTYRAWDRRLDRRVAVKVLEGPAMDDGRAARAFLREARLAAGIEHPHVVRIYDFGYTGDHPYLVMEHVDGGSLEDRIEEGPPDLDRALAWTRQILDALSAVHKRGIVHRDVKPANVLITGDGRAKLGDFGVALRPDAERTQTGLPRPSKPAGTPAYMAPETLRGDVATVSSDVYAVGAVLYECVAGRPYLDLEGRTLDGIRRAVSQKEPDPLPEEVPDALAEAIHRALAKEPAGRYADAAAFRDALEGITAP